MRLRSVLDRFTDSFIAYVEANPNGIIISVWKGESDQVLIGLTMDEFEQISTAVEAVKSTMPDNVVGFIK